MDGDQSNTALAERLARVSGQMPAAVLGARGAEPQRKAGWHDRSRRRHLAGYPFSVLVGVVMGYVAVVLVFGLLPAPGPSMAFSDHVMQNALAFGLILSLGPVLAVSAMIAMEFGNGHQLGLAAAFSWIAFASCELLTHLLRDTLSVIPPDWLQAAAAL